MAGAWYFGVEIKSGCEQIVNTNPQNYSKNNFSEDRKIKRDGEKKSEGTRATWSSGARFKLFFLTLF